MISAIPTEFNGVRFRSRLEAKWAAFFELVSWKWDYEPLDLDGYIPDFTLSFPTGMVAVEVKPIAWDQTSTDAELIDAARVKFMSWPGRSLIVGGFVQETFGEFRADTAEPWSRAFTFRCLDCGMMTFASEDAGWACAVNGCGFGRRHIDIGAFDRIGTFRAAANLVQWRGK